MLAYTDEWMIAFRSAQEKSDADRANADAKFAAMQENIKEVPVKQNKFEDETKRNFERTDQNIAKIAGDFKTTKEETSMKIGELEASFKAVQANYEEVKVGIPGEINPQISELQERVQKIEDNGKTTGDEEVQDFIESLNAQMGELEKVKTGLKTGLDSL